VVVRIRSIKKIELRSMDGRVARLHTNIPTMGIPHFLVVAGKADPVFHLIEVVGEGAAAGGGEAVLGAGEAGFEIFEAGNVFGLFELASVDAKVSVGGFEDAFEVGETEARVGGESADDPQANAFVNEAVELGELESVRGGAFASRGRDFRRFAALGLGSSHRTSGQ
jgi:hypothetical protein